MSEAYLSKQVYNYARENGCLVIKVDASHRGWPDRLIIKNGKCLFIELKNPNKRGHLSKLQSYIIKQIRAHGIDAHVVDNINDAKYLINSL